MCFKEVFFKVLQSRSANVEQKTLLVETLLKVASKPQVVMDIYLNFDCDPDLLDSNIFERFARTTALRNGRALVLCCAHAAVPCRLRAPVAERNVTALSWNSPSWRKPASRCQSATGMGPRRRRLWPSTNSK